MGLLTRTMRHLLGIRRLLLLHTRYNSRARVNRVWERELPPALIERAVRQDGKAVDLLKLRHTSPLTGA